MPNLARKGWSPRPPTSPGRHADESIGAGAIRLAIAYDRPVYDLMYLVLAQRLGVRVVTADQRFVNAMASTDHGDLVVALETWDSV